METVYVPAAPERADIEILSGPTLLEFGANWCGHCMAAQELLKQAYAGHEAVPHYKIEDGPGRPLGRSYRVKLWPTLVFLRDGVEVARLVRPQSASAIAEAFSQIDPRA